MSLFRCGFAALTLLTACRIAAADVIVPVTVLGTAQPWNWVNGGLNTGFQFGNNDGSAPAFASILDGLAFTPGDLLTVTYVSGMVANNGVLTATDADGRVTAPCDNIIQGSVYCPSLYMSPYPIYGQELVGTFADSSGVIVGTPFALGDGPIVVMVPTGATRIQMGDNDIGYSDNVGSWLVQVSGPSSVPEPASPILILGGTLLLAAYRKSQPRGR